jgi:glycosyltransferase involved in cell wall biosynthesis
MTVWIESPFDNLPAEGYRKQRYFLMAEAFARLGHRVALWTTDFNHTTKSKRVIKDMTVFERSQISLELIETRPYRTNVSFGRILSHRGYVKAWRKTVFKKVESGILPKPDLIIVSTPVISAGTAALEMKRAFGCKVVVDIQDLWPETFYRLVPKGLRTLMKFMLSPLKSERDKALREADMVTGVCELYRDVALKAGAKTFHRAYHGIDRTLLQRLRERDPDNKLIITYIGNLGRTYDLKTVIEAVRILPDVELNIAGRGPCEEELMDFAKGDNRVRFLGYLEQKDLEGLLERSDIGIVPMKSESFVGIPYKFADYASASLAILSSLIGESSILLSRYSAGITYTDTSTLVEAIWKVRENLADFKRGAGLMAEKEFHASSIYADYTKKVISCIENEV